MGKHGKKQNNHRRGARNTPYLGEDGEAGEQYPPTQERRELQEEEDDDDDDNEIDGDSSASTNDIPSKFMLYQQSVQKFFLMYVGGRVPLHLQEDFCGTALLSAEWLRSDARRTAVGLDMDIEALDWCIENNLNKTGTDVSSRAFLFHGNVLRPLDAKRIMVSTQDGAHGFLELKLTDSQLPDRDIVCAFNYSCCCLHTRQELIKYFRHVFTVLSKKGGIFVMDLYGGTSSECELRMQRKFPQFTYVWEQTEFDIIKRKTRISLHFNLQKPQRKLRHAFSYSWRLWSLPEVRDCLEEAGFGAIHFWMRQMPNSEEIKSTYGFSAGQDIKYEEVTSFQQQDSWNAYIVAVASTR